jgi:hypothetical protein
MKVGVRFNPLQPESPFLVEDSILSINIVNRMSLEYIRMARDFGHKAYVIFGHEVGGAGYQYTAESCRVFLQEYGQYIWCLTNRNEWNDWVWGQGGLDVQRVREENRDFAAACASYGVKFSCSSTLTHDWNGGNNGYTDLRRVYQVGDPPWGLH